MCFLVCKQLLLSRYQKHFCTGHALLRCLSEKADLSKRYSSKKIREEFISFFLEKNHQYIPSSKVYSAEDPSLLFVNAGMNQVGNNMHIYHEIVIRQLLFNLLYFSSNPFFLELGKIMLLIVQSTARDASELEENIMIWMTLALIVLTIRFLKCLVLGHLEITSRLLYTLKSLCLNQQFL